MHLVLRSLPERPSPVEVVERKGVGHPDTLCDAVADAFERRLARWYLDHGGRVLHHNVDKALLRGGASRPAWGGGEVTAPIELYLCGRVTPEAGGEAVPVEALAEEAVEEWIVGHVRRLDPARHVRVRSLVRAGSQELSELHDVRRRANDTSCGVGYAPRSPLEAAVHRVEAALTAPACTREHPWLGEDVKVMGVRVAGAAELTVSAALVDRHLPDLHAYLDATQLVARLAREAAGIELAGVAVNAADLPGSGPEPSGIFLTVTGTSAEAGDDGQVGRGNRVGGLIAPYRPTTLEATAGKNPTTHVGKLYNVLATRIAERLVAELRGVTAAEVVLVSRIGAPVEDPWLADVALRGEVPPRAAVDVVVRRELARLDALTDDLVEGRVELY